MAFVASRALRNAASSAAPPLRIGMIPADGIGKEVLPVAGRVLQAVPNLERRVQLVPLDAGFELFQRTGDALPQRTIDALRNDCDAAMFGSVSSPSHKVAGYSSPIVRLRKELDLYANVRPVVGVRGTVDEKKWVDTVIVRENTECLYIKSETIETDAKFGGQVARAIRQISQGASERIGRKAFELALARLELRQRAGTAAADGTKGRARVTICHKSNVLSTTDGLFRTSVRSVKEDDDRGAGRYSLVDVDEQLVDSMVYRLFREPHVFDVVVAPNLYGDIISDGAAALVGSLGVVASVNAGDDFFMGEPVHGSAPDIVGQNVANPIASIRSAALLLECLGHVGPALRIYRAVDEVLRKAQHLTPDLGGRATTSECERAVLDELLA